MKSGARKVKQRPFTIRREVLDLLKQSDQRGLYLDAFAVSESIIAACLNHFLALKGISRLKLDRNLEASVLAVKKSVKAPIKTKGADDLLKEISTWIKKKNVAINRIAAINEKESSSSVPVFEEIRATSEIGSRLAVITKNWLRAEERSFNDSLKELPSNGFRKMQAKLRELGWFVEWNLPCCQSCAWDSAPFEHEAGPFSGQEVDFSKVLFNHSQDCEYYPAKDERRKCEECDGDGWMEESDAECLECGGRGEIFFFDTSTFDTSVKSYHSLAATNFICCHPEQQRDSHFCFDGSKEGVKNLHAVLPIIEACGCTVDWDGKGSQRPLISW